MDLEEKAERDRLIQFFQDGDLYRRYPVPGTEPRRTGSMHGSWMTSPRLLHIPTDIRIEALCASEDTKRTFETDFGQENERRKTLDLEVGESRMVQFRCTHCQEQTLAFLVHVGRAEAEEVEKQLTYLEKAGVWPSIRPTPAPDLAKGLGTAAELYKKGLIVEKFGYGIGAFAYYRRVTEDVIERLLAKLREYAEEAGETELVKAIDATAGETQASKKIALVKELVPKVLRRGKWNPLGTLYASLSDGLHGRTDEECLDLAKELQITIEFLITRLEALVATPKQYEEAMNKLRSAAAGAGATADPAGDSAPTGAAPKRAKPGKQ